MLKTFTAKLSLEVKTIKRKSIFKSINNKSLSIYDKIFKTYFKYAKYIGLSHQDIYVRTRKTEQ